MSETYFFWLTL